MTAQVFDSGTNMQTSDQELLKVHGLTTTFATDHGPLTAIHDVHFGVNKGKITGIVGESGSGKSVSVKSILGLVRIPGKVEQGTATFEASSGRVDLLNCPAPIRRAILSTDIGYIMQNPFSALDPVLRVSRQFRTILCASADMRQMTRRQLDALALKALDEVGLRDPKRVLNSYPHELSGGMAQRVIIAMAMARVPRLIIADEPTTALDLTVQRQILDVLAVRATEMGVSVLLITHDLGLVARYCSDAYVFWNGEIVEHGTTKDLFKSPKHAYTRQLLEASGGHFTNRSNSGSTAHVGPVHVVENTDGGNSLVDDPEGVRFARGPNRDGKGD